MTIEEIETRIKETKEKRSFATEHKIAQALTARIIELEKELEIALALKDIETHYKIEPDKDVKSQATAVMVASDWHCEETVKESQVNGLNEFNERICRQRIARFFRHGLKLVKKEQEATKIKNLVLALEGDFISGEIHEELLEGNRLLPAFAIIEAQEHLMSGINYLLENSDLNLVIPCSCGNHSRFTQKLRISTEAGNSLERIMYYSLAQKYVGNKRVKFVITNGYHTYVKVYDFVLRFHHGHHIRYAGGIGGLTIPMNKAIAQWNKGRVAYMDIAAHFHQLFDGGNFIVNGSLIGYNAFALSIKASPERPQQAFFIIDRRFGKTVTCPIILTDDI